MQGGVGRFRNYKTGGGTLARASAAQVFVSRRGAESAKMAFKGKARCLFIFSPVQTFMPSSRIFGIIFRDERKHQMPAVMKAIDEMDVTEKVQTMDYLWASLEMSSDAYTPPAWHERELARREKLYAEGKLPVYDWAEVKARLAARRAAL